MKKIFIGIAILAITVSLLSAETSQKSSIKNDKETFKKYQQLADQNSPKEIYNLGVRYSNGKNIKKDMNMAHKLFLKSANMGYARAQYNMGILYLKGISVNQDKQKSLKWFEMASKQNVPEAFYMMGWLYEEGKGVKKDIKKALGYYVSAADLGEKRALERIKKEPLLKKDFELRKKRMDGRGKGNHQSEIEYFQKSLAIRKKVLGEISLNTADAYINLAYSYKRIRDYLKSLEYHQKSLAIIEKVLGKEHMDTALSYNNIALLYQTMGDYPKSLKYYQKSLAICEKIQGKEHADTASSYSNIGSLYQIMGDYPLALKYFQKSLATYEEVMGKVSFGTALVCHNIGATYESMGDSHKALKYYQKSLGIWKKIRKSQSQYFSESTDYKTYSLLYQFKGDSNKVLKYYQKSLVRKEKVLGKEHLDTAILYNNIGLVYQSIGEHTKVLKYYQKALAIYEKVLGKKHPDTATIYQNIGKYYQSTGYYPKALKYYQKALAVREKIFGMEHLDTAASNYFIGSIHESMGDNLKALKYHQKALAVREKVPLSRYTIASYESIGSIYESMGDYHKALEYYQRSLAIFVERSPKIEHPLPLTSYKNIADLNLWGSGGNPKALKRYQKYLPIYEKMLGKEHPDIAISYHHIGFIYYRMRDYPNALEYYQKSLAIYEKMLGKEHPDTASSYNNIGSLYQEIEDYPGAHNYAQLAFYIFLINRDKVFTILNSKQKEKYLEDTTSYIILLLESSYAYIQELNKNRDKKKSKQILQSGANAWLNYKGSIFDSENAIAMLYSSTKDKKLKAKIDDLVSSKRYLARLYQSLPKPKEKEAWRSNIKKIEEKMAKLTNQIASKATRFKEQQGLKSIGYQDITSHLKDNELYIDYAKAGGHYYLFSLDHKENISFIQIDKNSTKKIDGLVKAFREDINIILKDNTITDEKLKTLTQSSKVKLSKLYEIIIQKPLGETIKDKTSLIISPDGALRLLPFEALYHKVNKKYFIEEKKIRYIPSGKELVRLYRYSKDKVAKSTSVIFANPNFNTKIASLNQEQPSVTPNTNRSGIIKSLFRMRFDPLPGTEAEAKAIKATLNQKSILEYQTYNATESNLVNVKEPKILHIATHGFFINDNTIPNPMLKSGIALAGANASAIKGKSDGIVTALKLSGLDLKGTDLVVLSACQTGVVDINSTDSVSGLSKAFIQAGAKDIVMSLWSVDDQATKELMSSFYTEMKENKSYAKALKAAKLKMIAEGRHPFYWGAFVVSGL